MRLCATSDFHGFLPEIPECDLLLVGGDICPVYDHSIAFQRGWIELDFAQWLERVPAHRIVGIAGNHDFVAQKSRGGYPDILREIPYWTYLEDETVEVNGLKIFGSPYSTKFGSWAFMKPDEQLEEHWAKIPDDVDILLIHGPMYGVGDVIDETDIKRDPSFRGEHVGSRTLASRIEKLKLSGFFWGHIHEGHGDYTVRMGYPAANVSHVDQWYKPNNPPMVFDIPESSDIMKSWQTDSLS